MSERVQSRLGKALVELLKRIREINRKWKEIENLRKEQP